MTLGICDYLRDRIKSFLAAKGESIRWLVKQTGTDYSTIYRLHAGEQKSLSFLNARKILMFIEPENAASILADYFPQESRELGGSKNETERRTAVMEEIIKDFIAYKVFVFAATGINVTREDIRFQFGMEGVSHLERIISLGALEEKDGVLVDKIPGGILLSLPSLKKEGQHNIEAMNLSAPGSTLHNLRANLSSDGLRKWYYAVYEFRAKLLQISETDSGDIAVVATILAGPFVKEGAQQ
jgi:hypothetical protein